MRKPFRERDFEARRRRGQIVKERSLPIDNECTNRLSNWKVGVNEKGRAERGLELPYMLLSAGSALRGARISSGLVYLLLIVIPSITTTAVSRAYRSVDALGFKEAPFRSR